MVPAKKPTKFMTNSKVIGRELSRRCDGSHVHQALIDGRAKDAARYPPALCRALCRGISKEKMLRASERTALLSVGDGPQVKNVDPEEHHERDEVDIDALIHKIEAEEERSRRDAQGNELGTPGRPRSRTQGGELRLSRLTEHKNKSGEVTSVLAFDDITGMKLDAGKVIEARTKEILSLIHI